MPNKVILIFFYACAAAIHQLWLVYIHQHITPVVRKVPVVRSLFRLVTYTMVNLTAIGFGRLFPAGKDLYLNNVILCRKRNVLNP